MNNWLNSKFYLDYLQIIIAVTVILFVYIIGLPIGYLLNDFGLSKSSSIQIGGILGEWISLGILIWFLRRPKQKYRIFVYNVTLKMRDLTWIPLALCLISGLFFHMGNVVGRIVFYNIKQIDVNQFVFQPNTFFEFLLAILTAFTAGIVEEIIFRGFLISIFSIFMPRWTAAFFSILMFGAAHIFLWGPIGANAIVFWSIPITFYVLFTRKMIPVIIARLFIDDGVVKLE